MRRVVVMRGVAVLLGVVLLVALCAVPALVRGKEETKPACPPNLMKGQAFVLAEDRTFMVAAAVDRLCGDRWILVTAGRGLPGEDGRVRVLWENPFGKGMVKLYDGTVFQTHYGVKWIAVKDAPTPN